MKRYRVVIPKHVLDQVYAQVLYIAQDSIDNALAWEARVMGAIDRLGENPGFARDDELSRRRGEEIRRYPFEQTYLITFVVDEARQTVTIYEFRHGAREKGR